jgi:hypothetical protein
MSAAPGCVSLSGLAALVTSGALPLAKHLVTCPAARERNDLDRGGHGSHALLLAAQSITPIIAGIVWRLWLLWASGTSGYSGTTGLGRGPRQWIRAGAVRCSAALRNAIDVTRSPSRTVLRSRHSGVWCVLCKHTNHPAMLVAEHLASHLLGLLLIVDTDHGTPRRSVRERHQEGRYTHRLVVALPRPLDRPVTRRRRRGETLASVVFNCGRLVQRLAQPV